jgi:hypothetical protein
MSWFQLHPDAIVARARAAGNAVPIPSLSASLWRGIIGFTLLSLAGFAPWAVFGKWFYRNLGEAGLYGVCALVFIGLSGPFMHRLILGPGSLSRFYKLFSLGFAAYSVAWIGGWMSLRGHPGSIVGLLAGTALMGWIFSTAFGVPRSMLKIIAALFLLNAAGYFIGGVIEEALLQNKECNILGISLTRPQYEATAKLMWGLCYGIGFGAGLGLAFHVAQGTAREKLRKNR